VDESSAHFAAWRQFPSDLDKSAERGMEGPKLESYIWLIPDTEIALIQRLVGLPVTTLLCSSVDVNECFVRAPYFAFSLNKNEFLIIDNDWDETPKNYLEYYKMGISVSDSLGNVEVTDFEGFKNVLDGVCTVQLGPRRKIISVSIREQRGQGDQESIHCDAGLIFRFEDGSCFYIAPEDSISGYLEFSSNREAVTELENLRPERLLIS